MRFRFIVVIFVMALFVGVISQTVFWKNDQNEKFGWFWLTGGGWGAMVSKKRISEPTRPEIGFFNSKHSDVKLIVQSSTHKVNSFMSRVPWYVDCQEGVTWGGEIIRWNWAVIGWTPSLSLATISSSSLSSPAKSSSNPLIDKHLCCSYSLWCIIKVASFKLPGVGDRGEAGWKTIYLIFSAVPRAFLCSHRRTRKCRANT